MQLSYDPVSPGRSIFISISHSVRPLSEERLIISFLTFIIRMQLYKDTMHPRRSPFISYSTSKSPIVRLFLSKKASRGVKLFHLLICLIKNFNFLCQFQISLSFYFFWVTLPLSAETLVLYLHISILTYLGLFE